MFSEAQEFKTEFEKAAAVNAKLLSSDDEIPAELPGHETETEAEKLAEEVEEKATIETK